MILPGSYADGFAPRDGQPLYPSLWRGCVLALAQSLGPTGRTLRDWSGLCNHGEMQSASLPASDVVASRGRYAFDTTVTPNKGLSVADSPSLSLTGGLSLSCWVYPRTVTGGFFQFLIGKRVGAGTPTACNYQMFLDNSTGRLGYYNLTLYVSSSAPTINEWNHCGVTLSAGGALTLWLNGRAVHTATGVTRTANAGAVTISSRPTFDLEQLNGLADDWRIYNRDIGESGIRFLATRRGIAYELAPLRRSALVAGFNRRRRLLVGAGS
jgi:hypothetical protein